MKLIRSTLLLLGAFVLALVAGFVAAEIYQRVRYPGVTDTDGLLDIGEVFLLGSGIAVLCELIALSVFYLRHRKSQLRRLFGLTSRCSYDQYRRKSDP